MVRDDPGLRTETIERCLHIHYKLGIAEITYLPIGHDFDAFVYRIRAMDGQTYFLKIRRGPVDEVALLVPRMLLDRGLTQILAPLPTRTSHLWCRVEESGAFTAVLYPFIEGVDAKVVGLSDTQWREFGEALRAVHSSDPTPSLRDALPSETFALPSASQVERISAIAAAGGHASSVAARFADLWQANQETIDRTVARAKALGRSLQAKRFPHVLCHSDIHAANILVADTGHIYLIDWDGPILAPRERDLLFIAGGRIARRVQPREEDLFFAGYGPVEIDADALLYYRYERIVEDLGAFGQSIFLDPGLSDAARQGEADLTMAMIAPGGDIDRAEEMPRLRFPANG